MAIETIKEIYRELKLNDILFIITNLETVEMTKYASNAFSAMKINYINGIANLCEKNWCWYSSDYQCYGERW